MNNEFSLQGKVIIVTGATGILGEAFVNGIANAGGIVGVLGRNEKVATERAATIVNNGGEAIALIADVTNEQNLINARNIVLSKYGKIDGLGNARRRKYARGGSSTGRGRFSTEYGSFATSDEPELVRDYFSNTGFWRSHKKCRNGEYRKYFVDFLGTCFD